MLKKMLTAVAVLALATFAQAENLTCGGSTHDGEVIHCETITLTTMVTGNHEFGLEALGVERVLGASGWFSVTDPNEDIDAVHRMIPHTRDQIGRYVSVKVWQHPEGDYTLVLRSDDKTSNWGSQFVAGEVTVFYTDGEEVCSQ